MCAYKSGDKGEIVLWRTAFFLTFTVIIPIITIIYMFFISTLIGIYFSIFHPKDVKRWITNFYQSV